MTSLLKIMTVSGMLIAFLGAYLERIEYEYWHPYLTILGISMFVIGLFFWKD